VQYGQKRKLDCTEPHLDQGVDRVVTNSNPEFAQDTKPARIPRSAYFALAVLVLTNLFNMLDRSIVSILAESIKADLKLDDADMGFLLGTAFAVFYSIVGIAMGRISDFVPRKNMLAAGLALWSVMTALGGAATGFASLAAARIGVGVGEAVANPCSHSLLADTFPARNRSLALGTYLTGTFLGTAFAMIVGGLFVQKWPQVCSAVPLASACGLAGWQAALVCVGFPGLLLALLVLRIQEPVRVQKHTEGTAKIIVREIASALPPFTLLSIYTLAGRDGLRRNIVLIAGIAVVATLLIWITGDTAQWIACALGAYSIATWGQVQSHRDKPLYRLTYGDTTFVLGIASTALVACIIAGITVWAAPLAIRSFPTESPVKIGVGFGMIYVVGSIIGVILGSWATDRWKARNAAAPLHMTAIALIGMIPCMVAIVSVNSLNLFFAVLFFQAIFTSLWSGGIAALVQDLVLPRMRGAAAACYSLVAIVVASGIGPYWTGKVSKMADSLGTGIISILILAPIALVVLWLAARRLPNETPERRLALAKEAGEI
jgi:MFS family permease